MPEKMEKYTVQISIAGIADRMVRAEMARAGVKRPQAEREVSIKAGLAASTFENLRRGRIKNVEAFQGRIHAAWEKLLEGQLKGIESDIAVAAAATRKVDSGTDNVSMC